MQNLQHIFVMMFYMSKERLRLFDLNYHITALIYLGSSVDVAR